MQKVARQKDPVADKPASRGRAIVLTLIAVTMFTFTDATAKYLAAVAQLPLSQIVWVRFLGQFFSIVLVLGAISIPSLLATHKWKHQAFRSVLLLGATLFNFMAMRHLRLDQIQAIMFLAPLLVALLAGPVLGEWPGWRRMCAIGVGFTGVLIVIRPGFEGFHPAMLPALAAMLSYAVFILLTRYLSAYDRPEVTLFCSLVVGTYLMAPVALVDWVWPTATWQWVLMGTVGLWASLGHYLFILAHRHAPASVLAPFIYFQLVSVISIGYFVFGDLPDVWTLTGSAVIIASGIYIWHRERVLSRLKDTGPR